MPILESGLGVQIERSNGVRHGATIQHVDNNTQQVQVEWSENDEIKAKQVSFEAIFKLNPEFSQEQFYISGDGNEENIRNLNNGEGDKVKNKSAMPQFNPPAGRAAGNANKKKKIQMDKEANSIETVTKSQISKGSVVNKITKIPESQQNSDRRPLSPRDENVSLAISKSRKTNVASEQITSSRKDSSTNKFGFGRKSVGAGVARPASRSATSSSLSAKEKKNIDGNDGLNRISENSSQLAPSNPRRKSGITRAVVNNKKSPESNDNPSKLIDNNNNETNIPSSGRKSVVVGNIAQIQAGREKLRAEHAKMRNQKAAQREKFGHNPNWQHAEFIDEFRCDLEMNPLQNHEKGPSQAHKITVCVRKRPINKKEETKGEVDCVTVTKRDRLYVHEPKAKVDLTKYLENQEFRFDYIFDEQASNDLVYKFTVKPLVKSVTEGGMATCFAYGQTGTGKTHTMGGEFKKGKLQNTEGGLYCNCAKDIFNNLNKRSPNDEQLYVACSFFEIYSGRVFDLMNNRDHLRVMEDKTGTINVVNLREIEVCSVEDVYEILQEGAKCRTSGQNAVNNVSSRSHAIFQLKLRRASVRNTSHKSSLFGQFSLRAGMVCSLLPKLNVIIMEQTIQKPSFPLDLAGNERGSETANDRRVRAEGAEINKSLLALKECIRAMATNAKHIPFRGSQLTQVLRSSFMGKKSKTCMIAMISPCANSCEQTLNTLRYADRVKELPLEGNEQPFRDASDDDGEEEEVVEDQSPSVVSSSNANKATTRSATNKNNLAKKDDSELSILNGNAISNLEVDSDQRSTIESMSGIDLINHLQTTRGEKIKLSKEEIQAQKAADAVNDCEDEWVSNFEDLIEAINGLGPGGGSKNLLVSNFKLMKDFNSPDVDRIELQERSQEIIDKLSSVMKKMDGSNRKYKKVLDTEEDASRALEESKKKVVKKIGNGSSKTRKR